MSINSTIYPPKPISLSINMEKTGANIKRLIKDSAYTIDDIMAITGVSTQQAVYKWFSGKSLPSIETLLILSKILSVMVTEILVIEDKAVLSRDDYSYSQKYRANNANYLY